MYGLTLFLVTCLPLAADAAAPASPFAFRDVDGTGLELTEGGQRVFVYNYGQILARGAAEDRRRGCYLAPVCTPGGTTITDDFNPDHPHHRGISWMWQDITVGGQKGDIWTLAGFKLKHVGWLAQETGERTARLRQRKFILRRSMAVRPQSPVLAYKRSPKRLAQGRRMNTNNFCAPEMRRRFRRVHRRA